MGIVDRGSLASTFPALDTLYNDLHAHRELAFEETRSAARLAGEPLHYAGR